MALINNIPVPQQDHIKGMLKDLCDCAQQNFGKKSRGWRYTLWMKNLATLFYVYAGKQLYEFLAANLPVPCLSTVRLHLYSSEVIKEGQFRWAELHAYLIKRNQPLIVYLSEDGTKCVPRFMYSPATNQIVGGVLPIDGNGCPIVDNYPAISAEAIAKHVKAESSSYAYTIMAQPLGGAPPFCLAIFGTDNKFNASQVLARIDWQVQTAAGFGIEVVGSASDGDTRCMKVMRFKTLRPNSESSWPWFQGNLKVSQVYFQDTIHLAVKLKSKLLGPSVVLPMGPKYLASKGHLAELITNVKKDQHELVASYLDNKDKMNFRAAEKISKKKVSDLLRAHVSDCEGTATYLDMMRDIYSSCCDPSLSPQQRIEMIWEWLIFLRLWRQWITDNENYTLTHNFVTTNAYYCVEINAHAMIQAIVYFRDNERPDLFKPWLFNSQPCEGHFRYSRSLSSTFSTVVNFSIMDLIHRLRRIDFMASASHDLKDRYNFPRHMRAFQASQEKEYICSSLPEDIDIDHYVHSAFQRAVKRAMDLKIIKRCPKTIPCAAVPLLFDDDMRNGNFDENEEEDGNLISDVGDGLDCVVDEEDDENEDLMEDITITSGPLSLRTYDDAVLSPTSPFVKVLNSDGGYSIIRKTTLCWSLSTGQPVVSVDRQHRFISEKPVGLNTRAKVHIRAPICEEEISIGMWCAFRSENLKSICIGRVLGFRYMTGTTVKNQEYSRLSASIITEGSREIGCLCSWYSVSKTSGEKCCLKPVSMDSQGYYKISNYLCTIPRPSQDSDNGAFKLPCSLKSMQEFLKKK